MAPDARNETVMGSTPCETKPSCSAVRRLDAIHVTGSRVHGDTACGTGSVWLQATPATSPAAHVHAMIRCSARSGRAVRWPSTPRRWRHVLWNGTTWTQPTTTVAPSARTGPRARVRRRAPEAVLFGGSSQSNAISATPGVGMVRRGPSDAAASPARARARRWVRRANGSRFYSRPDVSSKALNEPGGGRTTWTRITTQNPPRGAAGTSWRTTRRTARYFFRRNGIATPGVGRHRLDPVFATGFTPVRSARHGLRPASQSIRAARGAYRPLRHVGALVREGVLAEHRLPEGESCVDHVCCISTSCGACQRAPDISGRMHSRCRIARTPTRAPRATARAATTSASANCARAAAPSRDVCHGLRADASARQAVHRQLHGVQRRSEAMGNPSGRCDFAKSGRTRTTTARRPT